MLKKMGMVGVGVTAGLLAAAPFASATECPEGHDGGNNNFKADCAFTGGNADAASEISGDSMANAVAQAPIAGNNIGNIADCSSFLNNNLNGNFSGNHVALIGSNHAPDKLGAHKLDTHKLDAHKPDASKLKDKAPSEEKAKDKVKEASESKEKASDATSKAKEQKPDASQVKTTKLNGASPSMMSF